MLKVNHLGALRMPTLKPRFTVTLTQEELTVLDRFAAASGQPRATVAAELLSTAIPELLKAAELMEIATAAPRKVRQQMVDDLANATADAMGLLEPYHALYRHTVNKAQRDLPLDRPRRRVGAAGGREALDVPLQLGAKRPKNPRSLTGGSK
jgi:hypothetical protein